jgi:translation initiation factor 3 subunit G
MSKMTRDRVRWGDEPEDDDSLPPSVSKGPDENGIKTLIDYYKSEKGDVMKKTTKIKVVTMEKKGYKVSNLVNT